MLILLIFIPSILAEDACSPSNPEFICSCSTMLENSTVIEGAVIEGAGKAESFTRALDEDEIQKIIFNHNYNRAQQGVANMQMMIWNENLAGTARDIAQKCSAGHTQTSDRMGLAELPYVGENVFVSTKVARPSIDDVISHWMSDPDYPMGGLLPDGKQFSNSGQVLNALTSQVGCGITRCDTIEHVGESGWVLVCLYDVGANIAGVPYWTEGEACSDCATDKSQCYGELCTDQSPDSDEECTTTNLQFNCECDNSDWLPSGRPTSFTNGVLQSSVGFDDDEHENMVKLHNEERSAVMATRMDCITWLPDLAKVAQTYADECSSEHSTLDYRTQSGGFPYTGENIFIKTGAEKPTPGEIFTKWKEGKASMNLDTGICNGTSCSTYTQIVWAGSQEVGCGVSQCSNIKYKQSAGWVVVCRYGPGGVYAGIPAYNPGTPCMDCGGAKNRCYTNTCCEMSLNSVAKTSRSDNTKESRREVCHRLRDDKGYCSRAETSRRFAEFMMLRCPGTC